MFTSVMPWVLDPKPVFPPGVEAKVQVFLSIVMGIGVAAVILGILIVAIKLAVANRRGEGEEVGKGLIYVIGAGVLITSASALAYFIMS